MEVSSFNKNGEYEQQSKSKRIGLDLNEYSIEPIGQNEQKPEALGEHIEPSDQTTSEKHLLKHAINEKSTEPKAEALGEDIQIQTYDQTTSKKHLAQHAVEEKSTEQKTEGSALVLKHKDKEAADSGTDEDERKDEATIKLASTIKACQNDVSKAKNE